MHTFHTRMQIKFIAEIVSRLQGPGTPDHPLAMNLLSEVIDAEYCRTQLC